MQEIDIGLIQQLKELAEANPEIFDQVKKAHPEWWRVIQDIPREQELLALCKSDSPQGYAAYYEGKFGFKPPWQIALWIKGIYDAHDKGLGYSINGYRGSWKSVSISSTFVEFRIGHEPRKTNLVVTAAEGTEAP